MNYISRQLNYWIVKGKGLTIKIHKLYVRQIIPLEISIEYKFNAIIFVTYNSYTIENLWSNFYLNYLINLYKGSMSWIMKT
jgi:hypothetical protein